MISVIMAIYKEPLNILNESIQSILNQTYEDIELIIISDNPDNVEHQTFIHKLMNEDNRIHFLVNEVNLGPAETRNKGIKHSKGEYIAIMDADDYSALNRLELQLNYLIQNDLGFIGAIPVMINDEGQRVYSIKKVPSDVEVVKKCLGYSQCVAHSTWLVKREIYEQLDGYRPIPLCEDYDFTLRASLLGYRVSNMNEPLVYYRVTESSVSRDNMYEQYLYMLYITDMYKHGKIADINEAQQFVKARYTKSKSDSFTKSNIFFNRMLQEKTEHKYISFVIDGFRLLFGSKEFLDKIFRFIHLSMNS